jgi:hypothetical protein
MIISTLSAQKEGNSKEEINCAVVKRLFSEGYNQRDMKITRGWQVFDNYQRFSQLGYSIKAPADSISQDP